MEPFWIGFEKQAKKKNKGPNLFKRLGKKKNIVIVGKPGSDVYSTNKHMLRLVPHQTPFQLVRKVLSPESKKEWDRGLKDGLRQSGMVFGGTIATGKKGTKSYISRGLAGGKGPLKLRNVVNHEAFHANVPVLGQSEIAAHFYGGLKETKGKISPLKGLRDIGHLAKTRPGRLAVELAAAVGTGLGIKKVVGSED